jgi:hypothetical protein
MDAFNAAISYWRSQGDHAEPEITVILSNGNNISGTFLPAYSDTRTVVLDKEFTREYFNPVTRKYETRKSGSHRAFIPRSAIVSVWVTSHVEPRTIPHAPGVSNVSRETPPSGISALTERHGTRPLMAPDLAEAAKAAKTRAQKTRRAREIEKPIVILNRDK